MTSQEHGRRLDQALRAEKRGEWAEAISIYEQLQADLSGQEAEYARNCALRTREIQEMSRTASAPNPQAETGNAGSVAGKGDSAVGGVRLLSFARGSLAGALLLVVWDGFLTGSFVFSYLVCPFWFLGSVSRNAVERPGWKIAILRIAIPALTLGLILVNNTLQLRIASANADRIVAACQQFHATTGKYPSKLDELVPGYLPSVPRAKYCLTFGDFMYFGIEGNPILFWYVVPPFYRAIYNFERGSWGYID